MCTWPPACLSYLLVLRMLLSCYRSFAAVLGQLSGKLFHGLNGRRENAFVELGFVSLFCGVEHEIKTRGCIILVA